MPMKKRGPDLTLQRGLEARNIPFRCMWEIPGPKNTQIAWLSAYLVQTRIVIVQTYTGLNGWDVFIPSPEHETEATINDVIARTKANEPT